MSQDDSTEWQTVTKNSKRCAGKRGRRSKQSAKLAIADSHQSSSSSSTLTYDEMTQAINSCMEHLRSSLFFKNFESSIVDILSFQQISTIVCYGVGNFGISKLNAPLWQLSFAIAIKEFLQQHQQQHQGEENEKYNNEKSNQSCIDIFYFDPCMNQQEAIFLERNSIQIISENERGKRKVPNGTTTLFFMPHCPMMLYSNLLYTNWENINDVIIFGNSLSVYTNQLIGGEEKKGGVKLLKVLEPYWEEVILSLTKEDISNLPAYFEQAFNDSSLTFFLDQGSSDKSSWPERPDLLDGDDEDGGEII